MSENINNMHLTESLPMLALRGLSVFPNMLLNFDVERPMSVAALNVAAEGERRIFLLAQKDITKESPGENDLYKVGTICVIKQLLRIPGGGIKVLVEGIQRASLKKILNDRKYFFVEVEPILEEAVEKMTPRIEALIRKCVGLFDTYSAMTGNVTKEAVVAIYASSEPGYCRLHYAEHVYEAEKKQLILETRSPTKRLELICDMLLREIEVIELSSRLTSGSEAGWNASSAIMSSRATARDSIRIGRIA